MGGLMGQNSADRRLYAAPAEGGGGKLPESEWNRLWNRISSLKTPGIRWMRRIVNAARDRRLHWLPGVRCRESFGIVAGSSWTFLRNVTDKFELRPLGS